MVRTLWYRATLALLVMSYATSPLTLTGENWQDTVTFKEKLILVLPVINSTGEKWEELKVKLTNETLRTINSELVTAKYSLVPDLDVKTLLDNSKIDLTDEENWRRETFYSLGQTAGAEFVVFAVITNATQRMRVNFFSSVPEGDVTVKFWILNAKSKVPLMSAKSINAKARAKTNLFGEARGSDCQIEAARRTVKEAVKEAFGQLKAPV